MAELVAERKFERAALLRDRLEAVHDLAQRQLVSSPDHANMDVFGFVIEGATAYFTLFMFRDGKFVNQENFVADSGGFGASEEGQAGELMESFLYQYYERAADKPQQVLVPVALMGEEKEFFEEWSGVKLLVPQRGKKHKIIELARKNAESFMKQHKARFEVAKRDDKEALLRLAEELERGGLELGGPPKRIEAYDVSHLGGTDTVASMVVFEHGAPKKSDYRKFRLKTIEEGEVDDYKSMREVLRRRFSRLRKDVVVRQASKSREKDILRFLKAGWDQDERFGTLKEYYLAFVDKKPIGMCRMLPSGVNKGELEAGLFLLEVLFVEEDFRGKGIAKTVLRHAIEKSGGKRVYLFCEQKMTEFYKKFGFKEIKKFPEIFMGRANNFENNTGQKPHFMAFDPNNLKDASFKARPDLVLIDGGKGQLGVALQVWDEFGLDIPVIGLAKREEEIFMPEGEAGARKVKNKPLLLPPDSKALYLLQRVRDEAHRFAITFQKKSRKKHIRKSVLDSILGLGEGGKMALLQKFGSVDQIADASEWEVAEIVGSKLAKAVMDALV